MFANPLGKSVAALAAPALVALWVVAGGAAGAAAATCSTTAQFGTCSYPPYSVNQDMWNQTTGSSQTLTATSAGHWSVSTFEPTGAFVRSYPNVSENLGKKIRDYTTAVATFADTMPTAGAEEAAFDIWVNGAPGTASTKHEIEVMVWTADHGNRPAGTQTTTTAIGGQRFKVWECKTSSCVGHPYFAFELTKNESSGKVHLLSALKWLARHHLVPVSDPLTQIDFGWEIGNTGGTTETFSMTKYKLDIAH